MISIAVALAQGINITLLGHERNAQIKYKDQCMCITAY